MHPLNQLNQDFYSTVKWHFHATRDKAWQGWQRVIPYLGHATTVADIGCGNGRFAQYIQDNQHAWTSPLHYTGIDANTFLLQQAQARTLDFSSSWSCTDVFEDTWQIQPQHLIVSFGVIHHLPHQVRQRFFDQIHAHLQPGGVAIIAAWRFDRSARFQRSCIGQQEYTVIAKKYAFKENTLGKNDYLIDWDTGTHAVRFVHIWTDQEIFEHTKQAGLRIQKTYDADGKEGNLNRYYILSKTD